jgi:hypothetical protein
VNRNYPEVSNVYESGSVCTPKFTRELIRDFSGQGRTTPKIFSLHFSDIRSDWPSRLSFSATGFAAALLLLKAVAAEL